MDLEWTDKMPTTVKYCKEWQNLRKCSVVQLCLVHILRRHSQRVNVKNLIYSPTDTLTISH